MSGEKLTWTFELLDRMSGPAARIAGALRGLTFEKIARSASNFIDEIRAIPMAMSLVAGFVVNEFRPLGKAVAFALEPVTNFARRAFDSVVARAAPVAAAVADRFRSIASSVGERLSTVAGAVSARLSPVAGAVASALAPAGELARRAFDSVVQRLRLVGAAAQAAVIGVIAKLRPLASGVAGVFRSIGARLKPVGVELGKLIGKMASPLGGLIKRVASGLGSTMGKLAPTVGKGLMIAGGAVLAVGAATAMAVGGLAAAGGTWLIDSIAFKETTIASLEAILKSKSEAEEVFKRATKFAAKTPFSTSQVAAAFEQLVSAGVPLKDLEKTMQSLGDLSGGSAEKLASAISVIAQVRGKGKLQTEELMQLAERGLPMGVVLDTLAKKLGKTKDEVQSLLSSGKISADQGIGAILETIDQLRGGSMEKASNTLAGLWSTLKSVPEDILFSEGAAKSIEKLIVPIKDFIKNITAALSPDTVNGQRLIAMFDQVAKVVGEVFGTLNGGDFSKTISDVLDVAEPLLEVFLGFGKGLFQGLIGALGEIVRAFGKMDPKSIESMAESFVKFGVFVGQVLGAFILLIGTMQVIALTFIQFIVMVGSFFSSIWEAITGFFSAIAEMSWSELGASIVRGIIDGIKSMFGPAANTMTSLGGNMMGAMKLPGLSTPGTASRPSNGVMSSAGILENMPALFTPPANVTANAAGIQPGAAAGGPAQPPPSPTINMQGLQPIFHFHGTDGGEQAGKQAADSFMGQIGSALKGMLGEAGG